MLGPVQLTDPSLSWGSLSFLVSDVACTRDLEGIRACDVFLNSVRPWLVLQATSLPSAGQEGRPSEQQGSHQRPQQCHLPRAMEQACMLSADLSFCCS